MDNNQKLEISKNARHIVKYISQYLNGNDDCYQKLLELKKDEKLKKEFDELQWMYIIFQAWKLAYNKAMADNYISPEERLQLVNIYHLILRYQHDPVCNVFLKQQVLRDFKKTYYMGNEDNQIQAKWQPPKPSPWDYLEKK